MNVVLFQMDSPVDFSDDVDLNDAADVLDLGQLRGQYHNSYLVNLVEVPLCENFYADRSNNVQQKLKDKRYDLLFADNLYSFTR